MITTLDKTNSTSVKAADMSCGVFIDNSGSTSGSILNTEKDLVSYFAKSGVKYVAWNSDARQVNDYTTIRSTGRTCPAAILDNRYTRDVYNSSNLIVFITDGEIWQSDVQDFNKKLSEYSTKSLIIGVIVTSREQPNISVFAPLMNSPNIMLLQYQGGPFAKLLYKKGIEMEYNLKSSMIDGKINKQDFVHIPDLLNIDVNDVYANIPSDSVILEETPETIKYTTFTDLLNNSLPYEAYSNLNWQKIWI